MFRRFQASFAARLLWMAGLFTGLVASAVAIGIRHDLDDEVYIRCALNRGEFTAGERYPDFSGVVAVGIPQGADNTQFEILGSGLLIGDRWIITAAHVVLEPERARTLLQGMMVRFGPDAELGFEEVGIKRIYVPIHVKKLASLGEKKGRFRDVEKYRADFNDIALLELADPVSGYAVTPVAQMSAEIVGQRSLIAGFGEAGRGDNPNQESWVRSRLRRAAENLIDRAVVQIPGTDEGGGGIVAMDFDSGSEDHNTLNGLIDGWEDLLGSAPSSPVPFPQEGACYPGDSGGPAFIRQDGEWRVVGVAGFGIGFPPNKRNNRIQYGDTLIYTLVPAHRQWIDSIIQAQPASAQ